MEGVSCVPDNAWFSIQLCRKGGFCFPGRNHVCYCRENQRKMRDSEAVQGEFLVSFSSHNLGELLWGKAEAF